MYKIIWNKEINGILLVDSANKEEILSYPKPVFYDELDLLKLNKFWNYPKSQEPLLWAIGRKYFYKGEFVAEVRGGDVFNTPKINITEKGRNLVLKPINILKVIDGNKKALLVLENESLDFIEHVYNVYKKKNYLFTVSYSGGKDSQVILELVTKVIPPDDLIIIFSDTTMEISYTYNNVKKTEIEYKRRYPELKFYTVKPPKTAIEFWKDFGPPSRIHRWCCTVTKTVPFNRFLNKNFLKNKSDKILVFDGVRSLESQKRSSYKRLAAAGKGFNVINAEVIKDWNDSEVFLYIFYRNLFLNEGYRKGLRRVGCSICPFASGWSEFIISNTQKKLTSKYLNILKEFVKNLNITQENKIKKYIAEGQWKKRAGGEGLTSNNKLEMFRKHKQIIAISKYPNEEFLEWSKTLDGNLILEKNSTNVKGKIKLENIWYDYNVNINNKKHIYSFDTEENKFESIIKKILNKSTYCVHCGACETKCPTGALKTYPQVKINSSACIHCKECLKISDYGCIVASSHRIQYGGKIVNNKDNLKKFGKYMTFGLRKEWLNSFLNQTENWFENNNLGNKQIDSMKSWLLDSELIDRQKKITELTKQLLHVYNKNINIVWEIIWVNLYYNSSVCRFYLDFINWGEIKSKNDIINLVSKIYSTISERTINSGISSLFNLFENSPIGKPCNIGVIEKIGRKRYVKKIGTDNIHPLVIAYSLYKVLEKLGRSDFTISELYKREFIGGPYKIFGIPRKKLENILRGLQENKEHLLNVNLTANLDNIYLREDVSSLDIVKIAREDSI